MSEKLEQDLIAGVLVKWLCDHGYSFHDSDTGRVFIPSDAIRESLTKIRSDNPAADLRSREGRRYDRAVEVMFRVIDRYEREALQVNGANATRPTPE